MSELELDAQSVIERLDDLLASQQVIAVALAAIVSNHPNRQAVADSLHRYMPQGTAKGHHTAALLRALESGLKGGYSPPRQPSQR